MRKYLNFTTTKSRYILQHTVGTGSTERHIPCTLY